MVTFTGSAATGRKLKAMPVFIEESVPFNLEADSLNACVLGPDVAPGTEDFEVFIKEVSKEITVKAGQKCTAVRRIIVPQNRMEDVQIALGQRLAKTVIGNPRTEGVRMGALASTLQRERLKASVDRLASEQELVLAIGTRWMW